LALCYEWRILRTTTTAYRYEPRALRAWEPKGSAVQVVSVGRRTYEVLDVMAGYAKDGVMYVYTHIDVCYPDVDLVLPTPYMR
jgi:hypothetical protein